MLVFLKSLLIIPIPLSVSIPSNLRFPQLPGDYLHFTKPTKSLQDQFMSPKISKQRAKQRYPIHELTFGTEQEFSFIIRRHLYYAYQNKTDPRIARLQARAAAQPKPLSPPSPPPAIQESPPSTVDSSNLQESKKDGNSFAPTPSGTGTTDSHLVNTLLQYIIDTLNHTLPNSPKTPSLLADVILTSPYKGDNSRWCLTTEVAIEAHRRGYAERHNRNPVDIFENFYVGAAELVAPIQNFDSQWVPFYEQIEADLKFDTHKGLWWNGYGGLHVHFGVVNKTFSLETLKHTLALYGLFETEIETWLHTRRRNLPIPYIQSNFCRSLRRGVARRTHGTYVPQEFARRIYATQDLDELRRTVATFDILKNVNVYISPARKEDNKKLTVEFRQHEATVDPLAIKWWIRFCGALIRFSILLTQTTSNLLDCPSLSDLCSFTEDIVDHYSILDLISFPKEGKEYYAKRRIEMNDEGANALRALEGKLLQERIERLKSGQKIGLAMDVKMRDEQWYIDAEIDLFDKYSIQAQEPEQKNNLEMWLKRKEVAEMLLEKFDDEDDWYNVETRNLIKLHWNAKTVALFNQESKKGRLTELLSMSAKARRRLKYYNYIVEGEEEEEMGIEEVEEIIEEEANEEDEEMEENKKEKEGEGKDEGEGKKEREGNKEVQKNKEKKRTQELSLTEKLRLILRY